MFTFREQISEIFIENKGRRKQTLKWTKKSFGKVEGKKNMQNKMIKNSTQKTNGNKNTNSMQQFNVPDTFSVVPSIVELLPKTGFTFKFKAYSVKVGRITENFVLTAQIGNETKRWVLGLSLIHI